MNKKVKANKNQQLKNDRNQKKSSVQEEPRLRPLPNRAQKKEPLAFTCSNGPVGEDGVKSLSIDIHPGKKELALKQILEAFGVESQELSFIVLNQILNALDVFEKDHGEESQNILAMMHEFRPQDAIEGLLMSQMLTCHNTAMSCLKRSSIPGQYLDAKVSYMKTAARFMRLFTEQVGALNKYRGKGEQKMTVEHVHVNAGGQAVIGNVSSPGGGGKTKNE